MQHSTSRAGEVGDPQVIARRRSVETRPLSAVHAKALYRPVPPVDYDDDGYPYSDSAPVESTRHYDARAHLVDVVRVRYADRDDVFAAAELGLYFERGNRRALVVPDAMVVFGIENRPDLSYKLWEHPGPPDLVLEVLSRYTWRKDIYHKPALYHALGVREYWLFDPYGVRKDGGKLLEGRRRSGGGWAEASTTDDGFVSEVLGLELLIQNAELRFREPGASTVLPDVVEAARQSRQEAVRADQEATRAEREAARAEREAVHARQETARAEREAARADAAHRRIAELEARLRDAENG